jgi:hypothetical protein
MCKSVSEVARVGVDFVDFLVAGETLTDPPTVASSPSGPTISGQDILDGTKAIANVAAGTAATTYSIVFTVVTSLGQTRKRYISLTIDADP